MRGRGTTPSSERPSAVQEPARWLDAAPLAALDLDDNEAVAELLCRPGCRGAMKPSPV